MGKLKKAKNSLTLIKSKVKAAHESEHELRNRQELTLLSVLIECTTVEEKAAKCEELGVDQDEVLLLEDKWKHLIRRYTEERNQAKGSIIASIIDSQLKENKNEED